MGILHKNWSVSCIHSPRLLESRHLLMNRCFITVLELFFLRFMQNLWNRDNKVMIQNAFEIKFCIQISPITEVTTHDRLVHEGHVSPVAVPPRDGPYGPPRLVLLPDNLRVRDQQDGNGRGRSWLLPRVQLGPFLEARRIGDELGVEEQSDGRH